MLNFKKANKRKKSEKMRGKILQIFHGKKKKKSDGRTC